MPYLLAGLGNPGAQYQRTRHNAGFLALEYWIEHTKLCTGPLQLKFAKKHHALVAKQKTASGDIVIAKPQTFMNNSGLAISEISRFYKIPPENILILHDELDLCFGSVRLSCNRGPAGHNGIQSIIKHLGTKNFCRARIGIASEKKIAGKSEDFVLKPFSKQEQKQLPDIFEKTAQAIDLFFSRGAERAMSKYN